MILDHLQQNDIKNKQMLIIRHQDYHIRPNFLYQDESQLEFVRQDNDFLNRKSLQEIHLFYKLDMAKLNL